MRYFIEVSYNGYNYSGFQIQPNASTIQGELENAFLVLLKQKVQLTGSSRTDAQVHAMQNFFHFDIENEIDLSITYNLNAILPSTIAVVQLLLVNANAHARFSATARQYTYHIHTTKQPFLLHKSYYYPFRLDISKLNESAAIILNNTNFISFCKSNAQVNSFDCTIMQSNWHIVSNTNYTYTVMANRFLRGMVKALVGTSLLYAHNKISIEQFKSLFSSESNTKANFTPPGYGLFLTNVVYPKNIFL